MFAAFGPLSIVGQVPYRESRPVGIRNRYPNELRPKTNCSACKAAQYKSKKVVFTSDQRGETILDDYYKGKFTTGVNAE